MFLKTLIETAATHCESFMMIELMKTVDLCVKTKIAIFKTIVADIYIAFNHSKKVCHLASFYCNPLLLQYFTLIMENLSLNDKNIFIFTMLNFLKEAVGANNSIVLRTQLYIILKEINRQQDDPHSGDNFPFGIKWFDKMHSLHQEVGFFTPEDGYHEGKISKKNKNEIRRAAKRCKTLRKFKISRRVSPRCLFVKTSYLSHPFTYIVRPIIKNSVKSVCTLITLLI